MARILKATILLYQQIARWFLPRVCRFYPSCSQYSLEAIEKYGVMKGSLLTFKRIGRCSPLSHGGYDPVK